MCVVPSGFHKPNTLPKESHGQQPDPRHGRCGEVSPKVLIAVGVFVVVAILVKWLFFGHVADVAVLESRRVSANRFGGGAVELDRLRADISTGEATPNAGASSRMLQIQKDSPGDLLLARVRVSREFLENHGKLSGGTAVIGPRDIVLQPGGAEPVFLLSGRRDEIETKKGKGIQFSFGGGQKFDIYQNIPDALWLAVAQIKSAQEMSGSVEFTCLFSAPPESEGLGIRVLDETTIALK